MEQRRDILKRKAALLRRVSPEVGPSASLRAMILYHSLLARYAAVREWSAFPVLRFLEFFAAGEGAAVADKTPSRTVIQNTYNIFNNVAEYILKLRINPISRQAMASVDSELAGSGTDDSGLSRMGRMVNEAHRAAKTNRAASSTTPPELRHPDFSSPGSAQTSPDMAPVENRSEIPKAAIGRTAARPGTVREKRAEGSAPSVHTPRKANEIAQLTRTRLATNADSFQGDVRVPSVVPAEKPDSLSPGDAPLQYARQGAQPGTDEVARKTEEPDAPGIRSQDRNLRIVDQFYRKHMKVISRLEYASVPVETSNPVGVIARSSLSRVESGVPAPTRIASPRREYEEQASRPAHFSPGKQTGEGEKLRRTMKQPLVYSAVGRDARVSTEAAIVEKEYPVIEERNSDRVMANAKPEPLSLENQRIFVESTVKHILRTMPVHEVDVFAEKVFINIERRMDLEMERRGT